MKTWLLVSIVLVLWIVLWYLIFLVTSPSSDEQAIFQSQSYWNWAFQNALLPTNTKTQGSSTFSTQSYTDKTIIIDR